MKKGLIFLFGIVSFLGINTVSADTYDYHFAYYDNTLDSTSHSYGFENGTYKVNISSADNPFLEDNIKPEVYDKGLEELKEFWENNLKDDYPYYLVSIKHTTSIIRYNLIVFKAIPDELYCDLFSINCQTFQTDNSNSFGYIYDLEYEGYDRYYTEPTLITNSFMDNPFYSNIHITNKTETDYFYYLPLAYYDSNFELIFNSDDVYNIYKDNELIHTLSNGFIVPTYKNLFIDKTEENYVEINLNDYSYVALSLKDYDDVPENNYSVYTNIYVKGNFCVTPVYNYGMTEKKDVITGTQVQSCSSYYSDFTLTRMYILKTDVENHAIYYLKAYDTTKENVVKIDASIFDISGITEADKDNPQVSINGKIYPTLAYDDLTDTAIISTDSGYISGVSCAVGDFNCQSEYSSENIFNDLFDKPLEMLKSVWGAIITIFELITQFILLLPPTMQGFLYVAFGLSIVLGIIKILL